MCIRKLVLFFNSNQVIQQLSKPKLNQQLSSREFEVRLHSYIEIHPTPTTHPTETQLVYSKLDRADNCPAGKQGPVCTSVQSHTDQCSHLVLQSSHGRTFLQFNQFKIILSGKKQCRTTGPDFVQMLL